MPAAHLFKLLVGSNESFAVQHRPCFEYCEEHLVLLLAYSSYLERVLKLTTIR